MNYLVKRIEHDTGEVFVDVLKIKENETYQIIEAESREEAEEIAMGEIILRPVITKNYRPPVFDD